MLLRHRSPADAEALGAIATETHVLDGYPKYLPADIRAFVMDPGAVKAWVAEEHSDVIGHVALHRRSAPEVMAMARSATGLDDGRLVVLAGACPTAGRYGSSSTFLPRPSRVS